MRIDGSSDFLPRTSFLSRTALGGVPSMSRRPMRGVVWQRYRQISPPPGELEIWHSLQDDLVDLGCQGIGRVAWPPNLTQITVVHVPNSTP